jgi:hypothetical protein
MMRCQHATVLHSQSLNQIYDIRHKKCTAVCYPEIMRECELDAAPHNQGVETNQKKTYSFRKWTSGGG